MPNCRDQRVRYLVGLLLVVANALMFASWPWLRSLRLTSNTGDPFFRIVDGEPRIQIDALVRNSAYLRWYFDTLRREHGIFVRGTSESVTDYNLAAQLNYLAPDQPPIAMAAWAGGSRIHSCVVMARCKMEGITVPPTIMLINLVYYMRSHDIINDGWLGKVVPSPLFLFMNDGNVRQALSDDVNALYDDHFRYLWALYPFWVQQYESNKLYLLFHQEPADAPRPSHLPRETFAFDGVRPKYDEDRGVEVGYVPSDQLAKYRWEVDSSDESICLKGLAAVMQIRNEQSAPTLLVILPMNRKFYQYNGMDMAAFDNTYAKIRARVRSFARDRHVFVADLYDEPKLDAGFQDRMHEDAYGFFQLARYLIGESKDYAAFIEAARRYYHAPAVP